LIHRFFAAGNGQRYVASFSRGSRSLLPSQALIYLYISNLDY